MYSRKVWKSEKIWGEESKKGDGFEIIWNAIGVKGIAQFMEVIFYDVRNKGYQQGTCWLPIQFGNISSFFLYFSWVSPSWWACAS